MESAEVPKVNAHQEKGSDMGCLNWSSRLKQFSRAFKGTPTSADKAQTTCSGSQDGS